jgi:N-acetylglucosamine-6-phosphate deacetylase
VRLGVAAAFVDGRLVRGDVSIADGRIEAVGLSGRGQGVAAPGFVDLQVNGFGGIDLLRADVDGVLELGRRLLGHGVTAYQPTLITSAPEETKRALRAIEQARLGDAGAGARILGVHLEGPFLSPFRSGTHPEAELRLPDLVLLGELLAEGEVTMVTLAPELPGADALIDELVRRPVCVSVGHSDASAGVAHAAFDRGARSVTHLFNAMSGFSPREPGVPGAALARDEVVLQLIVDGFHLADETVLVAWRAGRRRVALVSDAIAASGCGDGVYGIGSVEVTVADGVPRRADGRLAGSVGTLAGALRRLCELGVPVEEALPAVTTVPAALLGREHGLAPGARADLVVLNEALAVTTVLLDGVAAAEVGV